MKILNIKVGKERHAVSYDKTINAFFSVKIRIRQPSKVMFTSASPRVNITILRLTNPDVDLKRMHQLYNEYDQEMSQS